MDNVPNKGDGEESQSLSIRANNADGCEDEPSLEMAKVEATTQIEKFLKNEASERRGSATQTSPQGLNIGKKIFNKLVVLKACRFINTFIRTA